MTAAAFLHPNGTANAPCPATFVPTVTFLTADFGDIANATPEEVAAVINAAIDGGGKALVLGGVLTLASDTEGTGSSVEVTGGTANAALAFSAGIVSG